MRRVIVILSIFLVLGFCFAIGAQAKELTVATKQAPPFAIKNSDGTWSGISIDLWRKISQELGLEYKLVEYDLKGLLQALGEGEVDAAVAALTITSQREEVFDFSHSFYVDGLGIAVPVKGERSLFSTFRKFFSLEFLKVVGALTLVLLVFGILLWLFERKRNPGQFGGSAASGIGSGFWWSAVTMTTVGYGDKYPVSVGGRLIALVWMFTAIIIISSFTAAITTTLTVSQLETGINGPEDLNNAVVGTLPNSTSEQYLRVRGVVCNNYGSLDDGLDALSKGKVDAFVYDAPILQYVVNQRYSQRAEVLPNTFEDQHYGLAFISGSPLREKVNRALLKFIAAEDWKDVLRSYLGKQL